MPIDIEEFDTKGVEATRSGFGGQITKNVMALLRSEKSAFSLKEVAEAGNVDLTDKKANHGLMNVLYVQRIKKQSIIMKMVGGEKYYKILEADSTETDDGDESDADVDETEIADAEDDELLDADDVEGTSDEDEEEEDEDTE